MSTESCRLSIAYKKQDGSCKCPSYSAPDPVTDKYGFKIEFRDKNGTYEKFKCECDPDYAKKSPFIGRDYCEKTTVDYLNYTRY